MLDLVVIAGTRGISYLSLLDISLHNDYLCLINDRSTCKFGYCTYHAVQAELVAVVAVQEWKQLESLVLYGWAVRDESALLD